MRLDALPGLVLLACRTAAVVQSLRNCERSLFMIEHNLVVDAPNF